jgi:hypothetical protein
MKIRSKSGKIIFSAYWIDGYDYVIIPSLMIGFRTEEDCIYEKAGVGIAFIFLKWKIDLIILK